MKKSKKLTRKIISVILSVLMVMSSFTGVLTVFAKSTDDFHDENLAANFMAWAETTDEQTAEALLDYLDDVLQKANIAPISFSLNAVVITINLNGYLDSIDGILDLAGQVNGILNQYGGLVGGDIPNLKIDPLVNLQYTTTGNEVFSKCNKSYRSQNDAKDIIMAIAETLYWNSNDNTSSVRSNKNVIGQIIKGDLSLGVASGAVDVYGLIGNALGMWSGYQSNLVYNVLSNIILTMTGWYTDAEIKDFQNYLQSGNGSRWNLDEQLFDKLSNELMNKITVNMTYALESSEDEEGNVTISPTDSSETRYKKMTAWLAEQNKEVNDDNLILASQHFNYDTGLRYDSNGHVYIFKYNDERFNINADIKVYELVDQALKIAWKTVLRPTFRTMRVNNDMGWYEGHGGNYDNEYYYWLLESGNFDSGNWENNYTMAKLNAYAEAKYTKNGYANANDFIQGIKDSLTYERTIVDNPEYNWRDTDKANGYTTAEGRKENILFGKLRYSPIADKIFNMQTGPLNLYIMQTGFSNFEKFMNDYVEGRATQYTNLISGLNDALVSVVKDFLPQSDNIAISDGNGGLVPLTYPTLVTTNGTMDVGVISKALVKNVFSIIEYAVNAADENVLNPYYHSQNITDVNEKKNPTHLNEANAEEALVPLIISCITVIADTKSIHITDWDKCKDAEGIAFVALREYLSFSLPSKDYDQFVTEENGYYEAKTNITIGSGSDSYRLTSLYDVVLIMCRDAVGYLLNSIVPCRDKNNNAWDVYKSDPAQDTNSLFDILNSVVCYYASTDTYTDPASGSTTQGKGVASLIGVVDSNGKCLVTYKNNLWENIDIIGNTIWPTLGIFQTGKTSNAGKLDSKKFIYDDIVMSILNFADVHEGGEMGLTTIVKQLLTCFTSEPLMNKSISVFVYDDVLASLINGVFGAKVSGQLYKHVVPTISEMAESERRTPFDSLLQAKYIAKWNGGTSGNNAETGIIGILVSLLYGNFGGKTEITNATRGDGSWNGAMFLVQAVSYFIDGFLPQLGEHQFGAATVSSNEPVRKVVPGSPITDLSVTIKNNSVGLNRFYKTKDGKVKADDRYFMEVKSFTTTTSGTAISLSVDNDPVGQWIEPEGAYKVNMKGTYPLSGESVITFNLVYDVYRGTKNGTKTLAYPNQSSSGSIYISTDSTWFDSLLEETKTVGEETITHKYATDGTVINRGVHLYTDVVFSSSDIDDINNLGLNGGTNFDRFYAVAPESYNDDAEYLYTYVATDNNGNIINLDRYDYVAYPASGVDQGTGESVELENGMTVTKGYSYDEVNSIISKYSNGNGGYNCQVVVSNHIVFTRAQVEEMFANEDTLISKYIYEDYASGNSYNYAVADAELVDKGIATAATPIQGITFAGVKDSFTNPQWLRHVANTSVAAGETAIELYGVSNESGYDIGTFNLIITDDNKSRSLQNEFTNYQNEMSSYQPSDYKDYNSDNQSSATSNSLTSSFVKTLMGIGSPVTLRNARGLSSVTAPVAYTTRTTVTTGDAAYKPATTVPAALEGKTYTDGTYVYIDEDCTIPVYTNVALTASDVKNGKNALGQAVVEIEGKYYYANDVAYKDGWDTTTSDTFSEFPYYGKTNEADTYEDAQGVEHNYYDKTLHSYYLENGQSANESDEWAYSYAQTETVIKPYTVNDDGTVTDYRGTYDKYGDAMRYAVEQAKTQIDTSLITAVTEDIIKDRAGKYAENYDVATYEKMVQVARNGEKLVTATGVDEVTGETTYTTTAPSVELREARELYNKYKSFVIGRAYEGDKLEKEIQFVLGTTKNNITVTGVVGNDYSNAKIIVNNGTALYGTINANNELVNEEKGVKAYTDETWNAYVSALANAVDVAKAEKSEDIVGTYNAKKATVIAENNLKKSTAASEIAFAGKVTQAVDGVGTAGTVGIGGATIYANGVRVGTTKADGTFSIALPKTFNEDNSVADVTVEIKGNAIITRTFVVNADNANANIGVVAIDFNGDNKIDATDAALLAKNGTKLVSESEFETILKNGVNYSSSIN